MKRFIFDVRTTGIHVKVIFHDDRRIVQKFYADLTSFEERYVPGRGKVRTPKKTYATFQPTTGTYGLHRRQLDVLLEHLYLNKVREDEIQINTYGKHEGAPIYVELKEGIAPYEYQVPIIDYLCEPDEPVSVLPLQTGLGKEQPLDAKIKVPGGWSTMGEMSIGTTVIAKDGTPTKVIGVFPQGVKQMYRITFADGRSTECGADHLWRVYYINASIKRRWRIVNTLEVIRLISKPNPRVYIDLINSEISDDIELPLHPYILGTLIGDGSFVTGNVTISNPVIQLTDKINSLLNGKDNLSKHNSSDVNRCPNFAFIKTNSDKNYTKSALIELDLFGLYSHEKFIPDIYLNSSTAQRLALLQGLMDTDGTCSRIGSSTSYSTASEQLALNVQYLVRSLGGIASITQRYPRYTHLGQKLVGRLAYQVNIRVKKPSELFTIDVKKNRTSDNGQYSESLKLKVISVEPTRMAESQCIAIDHPEHLYVTDDFIVTHNTATALMTIARLKVRTIVVMGAMHLETWVKDAAKVYKDTSGIQVIRGGAILKKCIADAKVGKFNKSILLISVNTIRDYLTEYETLGHSTYGCDPIDLYATLGVGLRVTDEVHENLHFNFRHDIETEVPRLIYLSATIESDDRFINRLYQLIYPLERRYIGLAWVKYIDVTAVGYDIKDSKNVRYKGPNGMYSHIVFEQWIMTDRQRTLNYFNLIARIIEVGYNKVYQPGMKLLIIFSSVEMCNAASKYFGDLYPQYTSTAYNADHEDEVLHNFDIVCSTLGSSGTGKNIYGLRSTILTIGLSNREKNIQVLGRLRQLEDRYPGVFPNFYYLVCKTIPKQVQYHNAKLKIFLGKVKSHRAVNINHIV